MRLRSTTGLVLLALAAILHGCGEGSGVVPQGNLEDIPYSPVPYEITPPEGFPDMEIPEDNPMTVEGVSLGRKLFFDPILSRDSSMSCSSCHLQRGSFTDNLAVSEGVDGIAGSRSAMSLLNIGYATNGLFWDGRVATLEEQALIPIEDPIELHTTWTEVVEKLRDHPAYPEEFRKAFGITDKEEISKFLAAKALAQFERSLVSSGNSKYDRFLRGELFLSEEEYNGFLMYFDVSPDFPDAECAHCHAGALFTSNEYRNNGLTQVATLDDFPDKGRGAVTGDRFDNGRFRIPTLRNAEFTAPYMHTGEFQTLEEVIDFYNSGGFRARNTDPLIRPLGLTESQKRDLLAFLLTLSDTEFLTDDTFSNPF